MAKPNYQFEKRQRDLAKKNRQEEKRLQKLASKAAGGDGSPDAGAGDGQDAPAEVAGATDPGT